MRKLGFDCTIRRGRLECVGDLQPMPVVSRYRVEVSLRAGDRPQARILSPELVPRGDQARIPHTWASGSPCFYYPVAQEWVSSMAMSTSVVPWLGLWLVHYEGWRVTGYWEGGGVHPTRPNVASPEGEALCRGR